MPFFFKQWGGVRKEAGRQLDGRTYDEFPDIVENPDLEAALEQFREIEADLKDLK